MYVPNGLITSNFIQNMKMFGLIMPGGVGGYFPVVGVVLRGNNVQGMTMPVGGCCPVEVIVGLGGGVMSLNHCICIWTFSYDNMKIANPLYAKLSSVSTRGHQSQLGHMTEWGR